MNNLHINPILSNFVMRPILAVIIKHQKIWKRKRLFVVTEDGATTH